MPTYPGRLRKLLDAGQVVACRWCGRPHAGAPGDWSTCERCQEGAAAYPYQWPLAAALDRVYRRQVTPAVRQRTLRRRRLLLGALPAYASLPGAQPSRPVQAWSHLDLPVPESTLAPAGEALISGLTVRTTTDVTRVGPISRSHVEILPGARWPTWRTVIAAAIAGARAEVEAGEVCGPPDGWLGCAWCGVASAPRQEWQLVDGRPWCGQLSDCPLPVIGSPARDRAQCVAAILDEGVDALVVDQAWRSGRLPALRFQDQPDDERAQGGWTGPFGWLSDDDVDALRALLDEISEPNDERVQEALRRGRADREAADRAQEAREAELAEIRAEAVEAAESAARAEARKIASRRATVRQPKAQRKPKPAPKLPRRSAADIAKVTQADINASVSRQRAAERAPRR